MRVCVRECAWLCEWSMWVCDYMSVCVSRRVCSQVCDSVPHTCWWTVETSVDEWGTSFLC